MDSYRGYWGDRPGQPHQDDDDLHDDIDLPEDPPSPVGQDERRLQVRAYNLWASLLGNRNFPLIGDLDLEGLPDFAPHSVLLDFSKGMENPQITYLGGRLAAECSATKAIRRLSDVPGRSLLSRITDHYLQIFANEAPIGFEAEFVNQQDRTILYRGILLPFAGAGEDETIRHILGVINWKELVDQKTTDQLLLEIDQALLEPAAAPRLQMPVVAPAEIASPRMWADGPTIGAGDAGDDSVLDLAGMDLSDHDLPEGAIPWPTPSFPDAEAPPPECLADWLAAARTSAASVHGAEDRSRKALYEAIGRAWDFAIAAEGAPEEFAELLADAGISVQPRAPLTPVVKLVFGAAYDKTRLAEFAAALGAARRLSLGVGALATWLLQTPGGLKAVVAEERRLKRAEAGQTAPRPRPGTALARKLRKLPPLPFADIAPDGAEFTLFVARRGPDGIELLGEVLGDAAMVERAAKKLLPPA